MKIKSPILNGTIKCVCNFMQLLDIAQDQETDITSQHIFATNAQMQKFLSSQANGNGTQLCMDLTPPQAETTTDNSQNYYKNLVFDSCIIDRCEINFTMQKSSFTDVIFSDCNLSNACLIDCYFSRCQFVNCKGVGANFSVGKFKDVSINNCNLMYANFSKSIIKTTKIDSTDLSYGYIEESSLKDVNFIKLNLSNASLYLTPLKDIDLTDCEIANVTLSNELTELKGTIVTAPQAALLSKYLGIIIK